MTAVFSGLIRAIWVDGIYDRPVPDEVLATELYPDIQFTTIPEFYKSRV